MADVSKIKLEPDGTVYNVKDASALHPSTAQTNAINSGITSARVDVYNSIASEVETARGSYTNLNERLNNTAEEIYNAGKTVPEGTQIIIEDDTYTVESHAEIFNDYANNDAIGEYSHAEGHGTVARGDCSHAEGYNTIYHGALGNYSHAEGYCAEASGSSSHAEGNSCTASGSSSHAEGFETTASGSHSHAEGNNTVASGGFSHAEGIGTIASSSYQHVQGRYNVADSEMKYAFIIGKGNSGTTRSNAFAIDWNGLLYINGSSTGVNVSTLKTVTDGLGTASAKNVPDSGNASSSQVVMGNDTRLTDSRSASDVYSWAKASSKPSYSYSEISGLGTAATKAYTSSVTSSGTGLPTSSAVYSHVDTLLAKYAKLTAGTAISSGADLNSIRTVGNYACNSASVASNLSNCPYKSSGFRLDVFETTSSNFLKQVLQPNQITSTNNSIFQRTYSVSSATWSAWYKITLTAV